MRVLIFSPALFLFSLCRSRIANTLLAGGGSDVARIARGRDGRRGGQSGMITRARAGGGEEARFTLINLNP